MIVSFKTVSLSNRWEEPGNSNASYRMPIVLSSLDEDVGRQGRSAWLNKPLKKILLNFEPLRWLPSLNWQLRTIGETEFGVHCTCSRADGWVSRGHPR